MQAQNHSLCRSRAYVDRKYSSAPVIESADTHPFFQDIAATETLECAEPEASAKSEGAGRSASAANTSSRSELAGPAGMRSAAKAGSAPRPAAQAKAPVQLFDLLSLDVVNFSQTTIQHLAIDFRVLRYCSQELVN